VGDLLSYNLGRQYNAAVMSGIQSKIGEILDGFRQGYAQYEETVSLLGSFRDVTSTNASGIFRDSLDTI